MRHRDDATEVVQCDASMRLRRRSVMNDFWRNRADVTDASLRNREGVADTQQHDVRYVEPGRPQDDYRLVFI